MKPIPVIPMTYKAEISEQHDAGRDATVTLQQGPWSATATPPLPLPARQQGQGGGKVWRQV